jgi:uncharacterized protein YceH (UPF0502 family)
MCVLMLRGPQTPGELKQRTERMHAFAGLEDVHETLERLIERGLAVRLERRPGQKEERYSQLLEDQDAAASGGGAYAPPGVGAPAQTGFHTSAGPAGAATADPAAADPLREALAELAGRVDRLEREIAELRAARDAQQPAGVPG